MPKTLVFTAFYAQNTSVFSPLCTTYCKRMWNQKICRKRPCLSRPCPKRWYLQRFMPKTLVFAAFPCKLTLNIKPMTQASIPKYIPQNYSDSHFKTTM